MENNYNNEDFINNLVDQYKETGKEELKTDLINAFDPYFKKYCTLFCSHLVIDTNNPDTKKFLRLFMTEDERSSEGSFISAANKLIPKIRNVFKDSTISDVYNELVCEFLDHLYKYKPMIADHKHTKERISFTHYIQVNIRYHLARLITNRSKDALYCTKNIEFDDLIHGGIIQPNVDSNWELIDIKWVLGISAGSIFKTISSIDRYLLYLKYEALDGKEKSDRTIAKITGIDRMYIRRKIIKIENTIKRISKDLSLE